MNIFYLDSDPVKAAKFLCDKHISKMIVESAQLLSTSHRILDGNERADKLGLYKSTHANHPCGIWVRESKANYMWLYKHMRGMCFEYEDRYKRVHASERLLLPLRNPPKHMPSIGPTNVAQAMPEEYKHNNPIIAYRNYYLGAKKEIAKWNHSVKPYWWRE